MELLNYLFDVVIFVTNLWYSQLMNLIRNYRFVIFNEIFDFTKRLAFIDKKIIIIRQLLLDCHSEDFFSLFFCFLSINLMNF